MNDMNGGNVWYMPVGSEVLMIDGDVMVYADNKGLCETRPIGTVGSIVPTADPAADLAGFYIKPVDSDDADRR